MDFIFTDAPTLTSPHHTSNEELKSGVRSKSAKSEPHQSLSTKLCRVHHTHGHPASHQRPARRSLSSIIAPGKRFNGLQGRRTTRSSKAETPEGETGTGETTHDTRGKHVCFAASISSVRRASKMAASESTKDGSPPTTQLNGCMGECFKSSDDVVGVSVDLSVGDKFHSLRSSTRNKQLCKRKGRVAFKNGVSALEPTPSAHAKAGTRSPKLIEEPRIAVLSYDCDDPSDNEEELCLRQLTVNGKESESTKASPRSCPPIAAVDHSVSLSPPFPGSGSGAHLGRVEGTKVVGKKNSASNIGLTSNEYPFVSLGTINNHPHTNHVHCESPPQHSLDGSPRGKRVKREASCGTLMDRSTSSKVASGSTCTSCEETAGDGTGAKDEGESSRVQNSAISGGVGHERTANMRTGSGGITEHISTERDAAKIVSSGRDGNANEEEPQTDEIQSDHCSDDGGEKVNPGAKDRLYCDDGSETEEEVDEGWRISTITPQSSQENTFEVDCGLHLRQNGGVPIPTLMHHRFSFTSLEHEKFINGKAAKGVRLSSGYTGLINNDYEATKGYPTRMEQREMPRIVLTTREQQRTVDGLRSQTHSIQLLLVMGLIKVANHVGGTSMCDGGGGQDTHPVPMCQRCASEAVAAEVILSHKSISDQSGEDWGSRKGSSASENQYGTRKKPNCGRKYDKATTPEPVLDEADAGVPSSSHPTSCQIESSVDRSAVVNVLVKMSAEEEVPDLGDAEDERRRLTLNTLDELIRSLTIKIAVVWIAQTGHSIADAGLDTFGGWVSSVLLSYIWSDIYDPPTATEARAVQSKVNCQARQPLGSQVGPEHPKCLSIDIDDECETVDVGHSTHKGPQSSRREAASESQTPAISSSSTICLTQSSGVSGIPVNVSATPICVVCCMMEQTTNNKGSDEAAGLGERSASAPDNLAMSVSEVSEVTSQSNDVVNICSLGRLGVTLLRRYVNEVVLHVLADVAKKQSCSRPQEASVAPTVDWRAAHPNTSIPVTVMTHLNVSQMTEIDRVGHPQQVMGERHGNSQTVGSVPFINQYCHEKPTSTANDGTSNPISQIGPVCHHQIVPTQSKPAELQQTQHGFHHAHQTALAFVPSTSNIPHQSFQHIAPHLQSPFHATRPFTLHPSASLPVIAASAFTPKSAQLAAHPSENTISVALDNTPMTVNGEPVNVPVHMRSHVKAVAKSSTIPPLSTLSASNVSKTSPANGASGSSGIDQGVGQLQTVGSSASLAPRRLGHFNHPPSTNKPSGQLAGGHRGYTLFHHHLPKSGHTTAQHHPRPQHFQGAVLSSNVTQPPQTSLRSISANDTPQPVCSIPSEPALTGGFKPAGSRPQASQLSQPSVQVTSIAFLESSSPLRRPVTSVSCPNQAQQNLVVSPTNISRPKAFSIATSIPIQQSSSSSLTTTTSFIPSTEGREILNQKIVSPHPTQSSSSSTAHLQICSSEQYTARVPATKGMKCAPPLKMSAIQLPHPVSGGESLCFSSTPTIPTTTTGQYNGCIVTPVAAQNNTSSDRLNVQQFVPHSPFVSLYTPTEFALQPTGNLTTTSGAAPPASHSHTSLPVLSIKATPWVTTAPGSAGPGGNVNQSSHNIMSPQPAQWGPVGGPVCLTTVKTPQVLMTIPASESRSNAAGAHQPAHVISASMQREGTISLSPSAGTGAAMATNACANRLLGLVGWTPKINNDTQNQQRHAISRNL
eukprot:GHVN01002210.1.p1 GENE.GHVN01002210.1~~GHVN01002210.1.p1  ORF type:complete len:1705 (-),score=251.41 GHVN01002210.1:198-5312(-)